MSRSAHHPAYTGTLKWIELEPRKNWESRNRRRRDRNIHVVADEETGALGRSPERIAPRVSLPRFARCSGRRRAVAIFLRGSTKMASPIRNWRPPQNEFRWPPIAAPTAPSTSLFIPSHPARRQHFKRLALEPQDFAIHHCGDWPSSEVDRGAPDRDASAWSMCVPLRARKIPQQSHSSHWLPTNDSIKPSAGSPWARSSSVRR